MIHIHLKYGATPVSYTHLEYFNNNRTETQIDTQSGEFVMSQTDYSLPGRNGLDLNITRLYRSGVAARYEMNAIHSGSTWTNYLQSDWSDKDFYSFYEERCV